MTERRWWWCVALITTVMVAADPPNLGAAADPPDASREELLGLYRAYKLPLPPDKAKLVRVESGLRTFDKGGKDIPLDYLGFLIKPATADRPAVVLVGTREFTLASPRSRINPVNPNPALARDPTIREAEYRFGLNSSLAFALQCESRGWDGLAQAVLEHRRVRVLTPSPDGPDTFLPLRSSLADTAWKHWENALVDPGTDRAGIAERMRALLTAEPSSTESHRQILAALEATLRPSGAKPGTIEAMIDGLVNVSNIYSYTPDPLVLQLGQLGFEAVPALLEHWDDTRLTRGASQWHLTPISTAVRTLVRNLAGDGLEAEHWEIGKAEAGTWWEGARKTGEEAYLVAHVLPAGGEEESPNRTMLRILADRYPRHLPGIYRTILEKRPRLPSDDVVYAISKSSLPRETKLELLRRGANHPDLKHRWSALLALNDLDPQTSLQVLIATLDSLPETPAEPYWICPEAGCVHLVMRTDDPRAWAALERAAKRSDVGLRMAILNPMNYTYIADRNRRQRLEFLSHFLDDDNVRDANSNPKLFEGPYAGFHFPKIEVRNFAAWEIASILKMDAEPDKDWAPEQWAGLRARVRQAVADELAPSSDKVRR